MSIVFLIGNCLSHYHHHYHPQQGEKLSWAVGHCFGWNGNRYHRLKSEIRSTTNHGILHKHHCLLLADGSPMSFPRDYLWIPPMAISQWKSPIQKRACFIMLKIAIFDFQRVSILFDGMCCDMTISTQGQILASSPNNLQV